MENAFFTISKYPEDIYGAVGQIIKASQEWEQSYKALANMFNLSVHKISKYSLNRLNKVLKKERCFAQKEYDDLRKVIEIRNYINHDFYIRDFQQTYSDFEQKIKRLENILNNAQYLIFEATDVIKNKIDQLHGDHIMRPTIFD